MFKKILFLLALAILASCGSSKPKVATSKRATKPVVTRRTTHTKTASATKSPSTTRTTEVIESTSKTVVYSDVVNNYVAQFKDIAKGNMKQYGIPASIILAQGILESGAGAGTLSKTANNHFGIKCHTGWEGESVRHDDDASQECFRKYKDPADSYRDHAEFLTGRSRYASLFKLEKGDYEAWARGLRTAGYATDPKYPEKLISYIERYNLHQYDAEVLGKDFTPITKSPPVVATSTPKPSTTGGAYYEVSKGDTLYSISKKFNISVDDLKQWNNLSDNSISIGQSLKVK
ncbi:glucosaminidase domain-containing protein [uncultured Flavobacterium sp.]|uniref:glucosaminidase domain-containing protein n=1 Tax=uncultured Flavobacterium sp. TaxID=165435 RepID=UPI0025FBC434|nr:glucosaminidase domain-containing protein [uncultured Flavobacterium sp.]